MKANLKIPSRLRHALPPKGRDERLDGVLVVPSKKRKGCKGYVHLVASSSRSLVISKVEGEVDSVTPTFVPKEVLPENKEESQNPIVFDPKTYQWKQKEGRLVKKWAIDCGRAHAYPELDNPHSVARPTRRQISVTINPHELMKAYLAMGGANRPDGAEITLILEVPENSMPLPEGWEVAARINQVRSLHTEEDWEKSTLCLAINHRGEWVLDTYKNLEIFYVNVLAKYQYTATIKPKATDTTEALAIKLMQEAMGEVGNQVQWPVGLVAKGQIGSLACWKNEGAIEEYSKKWDAFMRDYCIAQGIQPKHRLKNLRKHRPAPPEEEEDYFDDDHKKPKPRKSTVDRILKQLEEMGI